MQDVFIRGEGWTSYGNALPEVLECHDCHKPFTVELGEPVAEAPAFGARELLSTTPIMHQWIDEEGKKIWVCESCSIPRTKRIYGGEVFPFNDYCPDCHGDIGGNCRC